MSSIRIHINGQPRHTVSLEGHPGILSCILNHRNRRPEPATGQEAEDEYHISFGGIDSATGDYVDWPRIELIVGDRIELEILESSYPRPPATRRPQGGDAAEYSKKDYIRTMAKQFGWELIEHEAFEETNQSESVAPKI
jgi:hypothetical protein